MPGFWEYFFSKPKAENLSEERRRHLERAHQELEILYNKVRELDKLKTEFFSNVSHELRTPLHLVLGPVKTLLSESGLTHKQREALGVVERNARTLLKHVNDLLDITKLEAGQMAPVYAEIDLAQLVRQTASHFDLLAHERQITLSVDSPDSVPAQVDPAKIGRVLLNLFSNAFKFTTSAVRCTLRPEAGRAGITIEDNGPGIPAELHEAVFERFRQIEGGALRHSGTGLGLAIARQFVELHGGEIRVAASDLGGASFVLRLPLRAPQGSAVRSGPPKSADNGEEMKLQLLEELQPVSRELSTEPEPGSLLTGPPLVLVVEDNPDMNRFIVDTLALEYRTEVALNGVEGLNKAVSLRPDLIVTDVMMPKISGDQMINEIRKHAELNGTPIVVLTGKADDDLRVKLLQEGAQDYLMKPFTTQELQARIGNLIQMKRARDLLQQELNTKSQNIVSLAQELTAHHKQLQQLIKELEVSLRLKDDFLATVSHELRTPMTSVVGWARILRAKRLEGDAYEKALETLERNAMAEVDLIDDLLDISRITRGNLRIKVEVVQVAPIIESAFESIRPAAEAREIQIDRNLTGQAGPVLGDPARLQQVIYNLLNNAVKFTSRGGRVAVQLNDLDSNLEIVVKDTGRGIEKEVLPYIFDPFRQADSSTRREQSGLGLGLAIVRHLVELHGGSVRAESAGKDQGATFTVTLPLIEVPAKESLAACPSAARVVLADKSTGLRDLQILVVDDDRDTLELLKLAFEHSGAEVKTALSVFDALQILDRWTPGILIADIGMPLVDGYDLIRAVRALKPEHGGSIPALALTAYAGEEDRKQALAAGFQMHVPKPVDLDHLIQAVASLLKPVLKAPDF